MEQKPSVQGMTRDITFNMLKTICILLNTSCENNYCMLAGSMGYRVDEIKTFGLKDDPTAALLLHWGTRSDSTNRKLEKHLVEIERGDVIEVLSGRKKCSKDKTYVKSEAMETNAPVHLVRDIDYITIRKICRKLNLPEDVRGNDYKMFADKVGLSGPEREAVSCNKDPTDVILQSWGTKQEATVDKMKKIMREMERDDVVEILDEYLKNLKH